LFSNRVMPKTFKSELADSQRLWVGAKERFTPGSDMDVRTASVGVGMWCMDAWSSLDFEI